MSETIARLETWLAASETTSRRRFLIRVSRGALAIVGAIGGLSAVQQTVRAGMQVACCFLAYAPNYCPGSTCPSGCGCYTWTCCTAGGCKYRCGECYRDGCSYLQQIGPCPGGVCPTVPAF